MLNHYVEFLYPGIICSDSSSKIIESRDIKPKLPKGAFAYRFYDIEFVEVDGERLNGNAKNKSGWHYVNGKKYSLDDIKREFPNERILISNMECNKWSNVVKTSFGQFMPLEKDDVVLNK